MSEETPDLNDLTPEQMVAHEDWRVREEAARKGNGLDRLVNDKDPWVRMAVAEQGYGLDRLVDDDDPSVRMKVAEMGCHLDRLMNDQNPGVRSTAGMLMASEIIKKTAQANIEQSDEGKQLYECDLEVEATGDCQGSWHLNHAASN